MFYLKKIEVTRFPEYLDLEVSLILLAGWGKQVGTDNNILIRVHNFWKEGRIIGATKSEAFVDEKIITWSQTIVFKN